MAQPINKPCFEQLSSSEWENHLKSWKKSGISRAEYCRNNQLSYHALNYWKKKFEKSKSAPRLTLVKLEEPKDVPSSFQPRPLHSQSAIRFWVKDFCIEVENNFSATVLSQLVQILRRI
ncbi:MAG: IS66 family insertion sequence element accessory protein TnpA [Planctomycetota bacterium]|jgi:hypothetical protein